DEKPIADQASHYPSKTCISSGGPLDAHDKPDGISFVVGNRLMKTCCAKCKAKVEADPTAHFAKLDKLVIEAQRANYKLGACPVSDEPLGDSPVEVVVANRLIKLCCEGCKKKVIANPLAALEKIDAAK
ncbi:MAG: hypothetical protein L3K26_18250, partial [Candidatus Hydrogenedentes bacterium]|nr:hypothetical protein [Candidatus Hydrogenedentota bacterium]